MCAYLKMCSLLQICVQYCIVVAYVVEIKLNSIQFNCGIRHVTVPIETGILIANVRHIGLSNICVINFVYFKMQV